MDFPASTPTPATAVRLVGYARHRDPTVLAEQVRDLVRLGVPEGDVYTDLSGPAANLPGLEAALSSLQAGVRLVVTAADRLARNTVGLGDVLDRIVTAGAVFAPQGIPMASDVVRMSVHVTRLPVARRSRRYRDD